jgi:hypothetical protein
MFDIADYVEEIQRSKLKDVPKMLEILADKLKLSDDFERIMAKAMVGTGASEKWCMDVAMWFDSKYGTDLVGYLAYKRERW